MPNPFPRDMIGYGAEPPHAQWPEGARIALQFVINYEEGAGTRSSTAIRRPRRFCRNGSGPSRPWACAT
jgi:hypothetical protein